MLGDAARVVNVVEGTATVLARAIALQFGQPALIPKLHGEPDDRLAALAQDRGDGGAVNASGHGHGDGARCRGVLRG